MGVNNSKAFEDYERSRAEQSEDQEYKVRFRRNQEQNRMERADDERDRRKDESRPRGKNRNSEK